MHGQPAGIKAWALAALKDKSWLGRGLPGRGRTRENKFHLHLGSPLAILFSLSLPAFSRISFSESASPPPPAPHQHTRSHTRLHASGGLRPLRGWGSLSFVDRAPLPRLLNPLAAPPSGFLHVVRWRSDLDVISFVSAPETKQCVTTSDKIWYRAEKKPYRKMWLIDTQGQEKPTSLIAAFHLTCAGPLGALLIH